MKSFFRSVSAAFAVCAFVLPAHAQFGATRDIQFDTLAAADSAHPGSVYRAAVEVRLGKGLHVNSHEPLEKYLIPTVLTLDTPPGFAVTETVYPEAVLVKAGGLEDPLSVYEKTFHVGVGIQVGEEIAPGDYTLSGTLRYQACDDKQCFSPKNQPVSFPLQVVAPDASPAVLNSDVFDAIAFAAEGDAPAMVDTGSDAKDVTDPMPVVDGPEVLAKLDSFAVAASAGGYLKTDDFLAFVDAAETGEAQRGLLEGQGPLAMIALILIGGMALNLTPCVLPLIPINLAIIGAGAQAKSHTRGFFLGSAYGLGMTAVYGGLGTVVVLTAGSFGTINASPWFNAGIAVLFVVLGLAMFDVITIDFSKLQSKLSIAKEGKKGSMPFAFIMGGIAALLAGACVAPVVIQVIVMSSDLYAKGTTAALALPFVLGLGMALPWPIAGAGMSMLPKPGAWMVRVKQAIGVFILGFAGYYGYLAYEIFDQRSVDQAQVAESAEKLLEEGWTPSLTQGLAMAEAEGKPVLVDLWATWCKNCLTMDKTTLKDPAVLGRLDGYIKVKYQAEDLEVTPAKEILERFGGVGLPHYAILHPDNDPE